MATVDEALLAAAMQAVEAAHRDADRYSNVGPAEVTATMRRNLRDVLDRACRAGWDAGYLVQ